MIVSYDHADKDYLWIKSDLYNNFLLFLY